MTTTEHRQAARRRERRAAQQAATPPKRTWVVLCGRHGIAELLSDPLAATAPARQHHCAGCATVGAYQRRDHEHD